MTGSIDLGQLCELLNQWKGSEYPLSYEGTHSQRALNACIADLQALIDGQAAKGEEAITWGTQYPGKLIKLFGAREIAKLNWHPDEGADLVGLRVVERVQPGKGEGE